MNEGIHLDLDTWIVPGQIRKANLCRGLGNLSEAPNNTEYNFPGPDLPAFYMVGFLESPAGLESSRIGLKKTQEPPSPLQN